MALVALGGAGPMHGCALAEELDVPRLLVPPYPGVTAALGLLLSDIRYDIGQSWVRETGRVGEAALEEQLAALTARARELLAQTGHEEDGQLEFSADMRYLGQAYNLTVPLPPPPVTAGSTAEAERSFVEAHRKAYDYVLPDTPTEIVALRVRAVVPAEPVVWEVAGAGRDDAFLGRRKVHMNGEWLECDVLDRARLGTGDLVHGPAIIDQEDTTTVVLPGWQAETVAAGSLLLTRRDHA
ncbi:hypothetical protein C7M71_027565 [Peterkaempfera bronchialis]|uniref:Hydantoinase A/oxoprolinase domain-containing protein n=2 Tax=Peterkaempfera bronchialis TaxID=2126346 RepID=A0A345T3N4_9ACTN|nr:hypothetical protein C7M71_027565 [Peterkaempfera bronchialis]